MAPIRLIYEEGSNLRKCSACNQYKVWTAEVFCVRNADKQILDTICKKCKATKQRIYDKKNRDLILKKRKKHYLKNKDVLLEIRKRYYQENKPKIMAYHLAYEKHKYRTDPAFRYRKIVRKRIYDFYKGYAKTKKSEELLGCTWKELAQHLEGQFWPGMTHGNHGEWHIDHIRPLSTFDLSNSEDEKRANHYTNLQPLWAKDNLSKAAKWEGTP